MKLFFWLLLTLQASAMKPGPFSDITYKDPKTNFVVKSVLDKKRGEFSSEGYTVVVNNKGKELWRLPFFIGRKRIDLSPKGQTLALIGNFYFGEIIQPEKTEEIVELVTAKGILKKVTLSDLFKGDIKKQLDSPAADKKGGGWVNLSLFFSAIRVDWVKKEVVATTPENVQQSIKF